MVQWGRQTCSNGYTLEYAGLVMSTKYDQHPMRDICVDREKAVHTRSHGGDQNGALLYPTEMEQGAADEVLYPPNREVGCAVCSKNEHATGCDGVEGSSILFDVCGICGGNGLPCTPSAAPAPSAVPAMCTRAPAAAVCAGISQWTVPTDPVYLGRPSDEGWSRLMREDRQKTVQCIRQQPPVHSDRVLSERKRWGGWWRVEVSMRLRVLSAWIRAELAGELPRLLVSHGVKSSGLARCLPVRAGRTCNILARSRGASLLTSGPVHVLEWYRGHRRGLCACLEWGRFLLVLC